MNRPIHLPRVAVSAALALCLCANAGAVTLHTYITGEAGSLDAIFKATFNPTVAGSASVSVHIATPGVHQDGIDFVPGTSKDEIVTGSPDGSIARYSVQTGATLAPFVADTGIVAGSGPSHPSTVLSTPSHIYYVENQFGFDGSAVHRIMRVPVAGGPAGVVFDGVGKGPGGAPLENFEGLEIVDGRLYFFSRDPGDGTKRALMSIGLDGAGVWDGVAVGAPHISGLEASGGAAGPADGSDELDFDPFSGAIFGTNIVNGEVIVWDPFGMVGGILISGAAVAAGTADGLGALGRSVDGIRSDGFGHLIFTGRGGVLGAIDIAGLGDGADDGDVLVLWDSLGLGTTTGAGSGFIFDDLTPMHVPEPLTALLAALGVSALGVRRRRRR